MNRFCFTRRDVQASIALALFTIIVYARVFSASWVDFDDNRYVTQNPYLQSGLHRATIKWAFTTGYADNWHPLTWLSHALDIRLYGMNPGKHHQINVFIHAVNAVLLFLWLRKLSGTFWRCVIVAALFAVHPVHVESVAWIAERKDVLSGFFWLLASLAYTRYARKPAIGMYLTTLALFAGGLLSKPMVVTLPFVLLLLDFWPLRRVAGFAPTTEPNPSGNLPPQKTFFKLVLEKVPFFALSAMCSYITYLVQAAGGTTKALSASLGARLAHSFIAYAGYVGKIFWPTKLAVFYPYDLSPPAWEITLAILLILSLTWATIIYRRTHPYLLFGWLFFLGTLVPVIGIIQVGDQSIADRYTYLPAIGIFIALCWWAAEFCVAQKAKEAPLGVAAIILALLSVLTFVQEGYWQNGITLFAHALDVTTDNAVAEYNYGRELFIAKDITNAMPHFAETVRLNPKHYFAWESLGSCYLLLGKGSEAANYFEQAIRAKPGYWSSHMKLGLTLEQLGKLPEAEAEYRETIRLQPALADGHFLLGGLLLGEKRFAEAKTELTEAIGLRPDFARAHAKLADVLKALGDNAGAARESEMAL